MAFEKFEKIVNAKHFVLFGAGNVAARFLEKYQKVIDIVGFTSNDCDQVSLNDLDRVEIKELTEIDNIYIIICADKPASRAISIELSVCFDYYTQYIEYDLFEELYKGKTKLILMHGTCHQLVVAHALSLCEQIKNEYIIRFFWNNELESISTYKSVFYSMADYADFFIVKAANSEIERNYTRGRNNVISIPAITFPHIWPQIKWSVGHGKTYVFNQQVLNKNNLLDIRAFCYPDHNVIKMLKQGMSKDEVLKTISKPDFYSKDRLIRMREHSVENNRIKCKESGFDLVSFLESTEKNNQLFLDGSHWSDVLSWEIAKQVAAKIGVTYLSIPSTNLLEYVSSIENIVWVNEYPVYPSVIKGLGLKWVDEYTLYSMVKVGEVKKCCFEDYMRDYITYTYHSLCLQSVW